MELNQFLTWLTAGGSIVAVSFILERIAAFQALASNVKQMVTFGACVALSFGAFAVNTYVPAEVLTQLMPWFSMVSGLFGVLFISQTFHKADKVE
jgi:uncharacterized membrane protein YdcZ (DUF606 family)